MMRMKHRRKLADYEIRRRSLEKLGFASYADYLASPLWAKIRARVLERDGHRCRLCPTGFATQVHHHRYTIETMRGKSGQDRFLISVCGDCHTAIEFYPDGTKRSPREVSRESRRLRRINRSVP